MLSTTDFERLLFLYKTEGKNMSIYTFCVNSGVNYRAFDKWFRTPTRILSLSRSLTTRESTYYTIMRTCCIMGIEVLKYFQAFFRKFFYEKCNFSPWHNKQACSVHGLTKSFDEGCRDFHEMILGQPAID